MSVSVGILTPHHSELHPLCRYPDRMDGAVGGTEGHPEPQKVSKRLKEVVK